MIEFKAIGIVKSNFESPADPFEMQKHVSRIIINPELEEGLYDIESSSFLDIIFEFHQSGDYQLRLFNYFNEDKGVFASRSPKRPNNIGITTVKLIERNGCELIVSGLDAINNTPVLDIKPTNVNYLKTHFPKIYSSELRQNPRKEILRAIKLNDLEDLLLKAGQIHGHFCPGLALGVKAATYGMQQVQEISDGMEDLIVLTETNNCASDGIQYVTGCTLGNNSLIFKDWGKTAFTFSNRKGKGIRIITKFNAQEYLQKENFLFFDQFRKVVIEKNHNPEEKKKLRKAGVEASFNVLEMEFDRLFKVENISVEIPEYAPIHESIICSRCGESTMATRIVEKDGQNLCLSCYGKEYHQLDGHGIRCF